MAGLKLMTQGGYVPRVAAHLLQDNEAQRAINTKLYAGDLRSWQKPLPVYPSFVVPTDTGSIYRGKNPSGDQRWIAWSGDVDVALNPIVDDTNPMSIYYTGDGSPKKTNSDLAGLVQGTSPVNYLNMGVPAPVGAPTLSQTGGSGARETRVYVYTYIQEFGGISEESGPSPISAEINCHINHAVDVTGFSAPPTLHQNITKRRIYRSATGTGSTTLLFVAEIPLSTTTFVDNVAAAALGEELGTLMFEEPPADLAGIEAHPSGFLVGFVGNELCMSEIGAPHAWPTAYRLSIGAEIVGIGIFGQSVAVMTRGFPYIVTGLTPESMSPEKIPDLEPCIAKRSIASDNTGVFYASPNGICVIGPGVTGLTTGAIMLRDEFRKFNPSSLIAGIYAGKYFAFFNQAEEAIEQGCLILDRTLPASPLSISTLTAKACVVDIETANFYIVQTDRIEAWEGDPDNNLPYEWLSKRFIFTYPTNLGAIEVDADFNNIADAEALQRRIEEIIAHNQALFATGVPLEGSLDDVPFNHFQFNGSILTTIPNQIDDRYLFVELIVDDKPIHLEAYSQSGVYRLPATYRGRAFEVRIAGNIECRYVKMAETAKELKTL
jgi:hypothetical protein